VTDIVSGGTGSELYRVALPDEYCDLTPDQLSARLRTEHQATLLAVVRDGTSIANPTADFRLRRGDDAVVVAESLGTLSPLDSGDALHPAATRDRSVAQALKDVVAPGPPDGAPALGS
jgi:voltage-gated potassium channel